MKFDHFGRGKAVIEYFGSVATSMGHFAVKVFVMDEFGFCFRAENSAEINVFETK